MPRLRGTTTYGTPSEAAAAGGISGRRRPDGVRDLRDLRRIADSAKNDLQEEVRPEFSFEIEDLNPRRFMHKHLVGNLNGEPDRRAAAPPRDARQDRANETLLAPGERPPYDPDAT